MNKALNEVNVKNFYEHVALKFQLFNSLFTALPFYKMEKTGVLLSLFLMHCEEEFALQKNPQEIIDSFFKKHTQINNQQEKFQTLFSFIKYVERQVVLFDALEDAAFPFINDMMGNGTWKHLESAVITQNKTEKLQKILSDFSVRLTLTAHPTQFYPGNVLGIINDLSVSIQKNNTKEINNLLLQLGKTPFFKKEKPSPYDEAVNLIWYLENVFYSSITNIVAEANKLIPDFIKNNSCNLIEMGFWPGGDRDGNPFVKADTTIKVGEELKSSILKCYYLDIRKLKRKLTFKNVDVIIESLEKTLYQIVFLKKEQPDFTKEKLITSLIQIKNILINEHNSLFLERLNKLIYKVQIFGFYFASIDIRQESTMHESFYQELFEKKIISKNYKECNEVQRLEILNSLQPLTNINFTNPIHQDILESVKAMLSIQQKNGEKGCHRYIISQCNSLANIIEVYTFFKLINWKENLNVDIVPLFETIQDLANAPEILQKLFTHPEYKTHLKNRNNKQHVMLGFSDGTKDGGYFMANWRIFKARESLTEIAKNQNIDLVFFDGRGGPPARGGGKTHKFYASMGKNISNDSIQLTIQGQTISSNYGTTDSAKYNIEQLVHAGIYGQIFNINEKTFKPNEEILLEHFAQISFNKYSELKSAQNFINYLSDISPLRFYSETNIGSRPAKRNKTSQLTLQDLRAIPYVGAWSQIKQNVTGYYGVGTALQQIKNENKFNELKTLYKNSLFFRTLIDNCEMAMSKCFFNLTFYLSKDNIYKNIWQNIYDEFILTRDLILELSDKKKLMEEYPTESVSIQMRERIVLPLLAIQQFGLEALRNMEDEKIDETIKNLYEKLITRCSFGIINSSRNSA